MEQRDVAREAKMVRRQVLKPELYAALRRERGEPLTVEEKRQHAVDCALVEECAETLRSRMRVRHQRFSRDSALEVLDKLGQLLAEQGVGRE